MTGVREELNQEISAVIDQVHQVSDIPCAVGFGIATPEQAREMAAFADGVIVGSAIVKIVEEKGRDSILAVGQYVKQMKQAIG